MMSALDLATAKMTRREFTGGIALAAAAVPCGGEAALGARPKQDVLRAGAAETVITPPAEGTFLVGPMKPSTGVHDDLYGRALVLASGDMQVALLTLDYLGLDMASNDIVLASIARASGIPAGNVMVNYSHTHSAPLTVPWGPWEKERDKPYLKALPDKLARLVQQAQERLRPAQLRYRREPVQIGFNRRLLHEGRIVMAPNPQGAVLPWVDVLAVDALEGGPVAVLFTHAAHPVIVHATSTQIGADYPGFAVKTLRDAEKTECVYMFAQGCGGNINAFPLQGGLTAAAAVGRDLGQAVLRAIRPGCEQVSAPRLRPCSADLTLPLASPPPAGELRKILASETNAEKRQRRQELLAIAESGKQPTMRFPIRGLALGHDLCILGLPHEPFAEYQQFVRQASPFRHTMVFGYTNGLECYVGTEKDYLLGERGGYETSPLGAAVMYKGRLPLASQAEREIHAGIDRLLKALHAA